MDGVCMDGKDRFGSINNLIYICIMNLTVIIVGRIEAGCIEKCGSGGFVYYSDF